MRKRIKQVSAFVMAIAIVCSTWMLSDVYAAIAVDTTQQCKLQINCNLQVDPTTLEDYETTYPEVSSNGVTVNIYKVADIDKTGEYAIVSALNHKTDLVSAIESINLNRTASTWETLAAMMKEAITAESIAVTKSQITSKTGSTTFEGLETGLYLIDAQELITAEYRYVFSPYLISLPNNYYYDFVKTAGSSDPVGEIPANADDWIYELTEDYAVGLKPQQFNRYGYLVIEKDLENYNETNPSAVFVYEVIAKKGEDGIVFNDVVAIDFTNPDSSKVKVGPIVAGAEVTVTEVYQGAGYEQTKVEPEKALLIKANEYWDKCDTYGDAKAKPMDTLPDNSAAITAQNSFAKVKFTNVHNDVPNGGTGVVNTYKLAEDGSGFKWNSGQEYQGQEAPSASVTP